MGCYPSDAIPKCTKFPCALVVNFDASDKAGSHWIAIYAPNKSVAYYFDSIASEGVHAIRKYLNENFLIIRSSKKPLQAPGTTVCGQYAIFFIYLCALNYSMNQITNMLIRSGNSDKYVVDFVAKNVM
jgi:hypothetical protein